MNFNLKNFWFIQILIFSILMSLSLAARSEVNPELWPYIQERMFKGKNIVSADFIKITGPKRASSGAQVPINIQLAAKEGIEIKKIFLIIDANPTQHAATYLLTDATQNLDLSTRIRMETDSFVRVVGEAADGKLYMSEVAIRASGGCSGYMNVNDPEHSKDLGKILIKSEDNYLTARIKHPNFTGLQRDSLSGWYVPEWIITDVSINFNGKNILKVESGISISEDPYIKFNFSPKSPGEITILANDTKGQSFSLGKSI